MNKIVKIVLEQWVLNILNILKFSVKTIMYFFLDNGLCKVVW